MEASTSLAGVVSILIVAAIVSTTDEKLTTLIDQVLRLTEVVAAGRESAAAFPGPTPTTSAHVAAPTSLKDYLGFGALTGTTKRTDAEIGLMATTSGASSIDRSQLSATDRLKLKNEAAAGLTSNIKAIDFSQGTEEVTSLNNIVELMSNLEDLERFLERFGHHKVLWILEFDDDEDNPKDPSTVPPTYVLDRKYNDVSNEQVLKHCVHVLQHGTSFEFEDLATSYEAIYNSCAPDLKTRMDTRLILQPKIGRHTGPVA